MSYKKLKKVYRIQDNCIGSLSIIKALLSILHERNISRYPTNYLLTVVMRDAKSTAKNFYETTNILSKYIRRTR